MKATKWTDSSGWSMNGIPLRRDLLLLREIRLARSVVCIFFLSNFFFFATPSSKQNLSSMARD